MGNGKLFGQEQKFNRQRQNQWANVQARDYRARQVDPLEVLRRREALRARLAQGGADQARRAQEEAEAREERDRLEAEARAQELFRQQREQILLLRRQRRELEKATKRAVNTLQEIQQKAQQEAARLQQAALNKAIQDQYDADLATLSDIRAALPVLRTRAQDTLRRVETLLRLLSATPGPDRVALQNSSVVLNQIIARCTLAIATAGTQYQIMMAADIDVTEAATRTAVVNLQTVLNDHANDDLAVTQHLADTALIEGTYNASLALMNLYPNLNLTHDLIGRNNGPIARLNAGQLATLNTKLANHPVQSWVQTNLPANRPLGNISCWIPSQLLNFPYQPGGEIFCDWVFVNDNHGYTAAAMLRYLTPISNGTMTITQGMGFVQNLVRQPSQGNQLVTMNNSNVRIVFNNAMTLLITYFIA